jgi:hypothetical protein
VLLVYSYVIGRRRSNGGKNIMTAAETLVALAVAAEVDTALAMAATLSNVKWRRQ